MRFCPLACCVSVCVAAHAVLPAVQCTAAAPAADVVQDLLADGVPVTSGASLKLSAPLMPAGLSGPQQQEALRKAAGKYPLDRFVRRSIVAPFTLDMTAVGEEPGARRGQRIEFCFVAYGSLAAIIDDDLFSALAGTQEPGTTEGATVSVRSLTDAELAAHQLAPEKSADAQESFLYLDVPLLNRVQLRGVGHAYRRRQQGSIVAGIKLDDRFAGDAKLASTWSPLVRDPGGKLSVGQPHPYAGLGGYVKITALDEPRDALFVECHIAIDEPEGWFGGKNLLRSKLPLVVQDNVRTFRRKLGNAASD